MFQVISAETSEAIEKNRKNSTRYIDSSLSFKGLEEVRENLRPEVNNYCQPPDIHIISPMRRAVQTAFQGFYTYIKYRAIGQIVLDHRVRETENGLKFEDDKGTPTSKWSKEFFNPNFYADMDIYGTLKTFGDNLGFANAIAKSYWDEKYADRGDIEDKSRMHDFKTYVDELKKTKRVAVVTHTGVFKEIWNQYPMNARPIFIRLI